MSKLSLLKTFVSWVFFVVLVSYAAFLAYDIRLYAITDIWPGIHEFDPWFNFRATKYFDKHGWTKFFKWYDYRSWYPIGRPVGTTIYPGLQIAAVYLHRILKYFGSKMTLYNVCVYFPAWFGGVASVFTGLLGWECSNSVIAGVVSAFVMAYIPCHSMRSIGGGFDNESLAYSLMVSTFYFWVRSLRKSSSLYTIIFFGLLSGISGVFMAAAWGGYIFVINMIGVHALFTIIKYHVFKEWKDEWLRFYFAYSLWFIISTIGSIYVPVINWTPIRSMENLLPLVIFVIVQILTYAQLFNKKKVDDIEKEVEKTHKKGFRSGKKKSSNLLSTKMYLIFVGLAASFFIFFVMYIFDFFGPLSVRVRSLFIEHSKTGNPLVDSVAEHQPTNHQMYEVYLGITGKLAPYAVLLTFINRSNARYFLLFYSLVTYYFSRKMNRLIILGGAPASCLTGLFISTIINWTISNAVDMFKWVGSNNITQKKDKKKGKEKEKEKKKKKKKGKGKKRYEEKEMEYKRAFKEIKSNFLRVYNTSFGIGIRLLLSTLIISYCIKFVPEFFIKGREFAKHNSNPQLVFKTKLRTGEDVLIDDYLKAYEWLRDNTPEDSRVLAWWDYGYQISGVGERISLADGNTWNLEHIAFIGRMLTSPQKQAWETARHVADYVLVWAGGGGDDLAKSPHIARIASSVYDICGSRDPLCHSFGFSQDPRTQRRIPSKSMKRSLLYNLIMDGRSQDAKVNTKYFKERFRTQYGLVRIYQILNTSPKSKKWAMNPENWVCDAPGSWYCVGQYPPAVKPPPKTHRNIKYDSRGQLIV